MSATDFMALAVGALPVALVGLVLVGLRQPAGLITAFVGGVAAGELFHRVNARGLTAELMHASPPPDGYRVVRAWRVAVRLAVVVLLWALFTAVLIEASPSEIIAGVFAAVPLAVAFGAARGAAWLAGEERRLGVRLLRGGVFGRGGTRSLSAFYRLETGARKGGS